MIETAGRVGWPVASRHSFGSVAEMIERASVLPANSEGFVVRWNHGTRLKIKGAEYRRIHALISRCTPIALWEAWCAGDDLKKMRQLLPEEFWPDFDEILRLLRAAEAERQARLIRLAEEASHMADKDVGLALQSYPADLRPLLFHYRKQGWAAVRGKVQRSLRPTGNVLDGYTPSYAIGRALEDVG